MGRLERKLDTGLIRRVLARIKPAPEPLKKKKPPRSADTYRAAIRNALRGTWLTTKRQRQLAA
jgi:hypothetical protein